MSVRIQYAYLKQQTWLYRRNYPRELQPMLGQAMKQSLKTGDARVAKARAAEVNATYDELVKKARVGILVQKPAPIRLVPAAFSAIDVQVIGRVKVSELGRVYLNKRSDELRPGGLQERAVWCWLVCVALRGATDRAVDTRRCEGIFPAGGSAFSTCG